MTNATAPDTLAPTHNREMAEFCTGMASIVGWTFKGTRITPTDLRSKVSQAGQDPTKVPDIDPVKALESAVADFRVRDGKRVIRKAGIPFKDQDHVVVNILEYRKDSNRESSWVTVDTLVWDTLSNQWSEDGTSQDAEGLRDRVADRQTFYDGNAVREHLVMPAIKQAKSITFRPGTYVVPHLTNEPVARVQQALEDLDSFTLSVMTVARDAQSQRSMGSLATESVRDEMAELQEQIDGGKDMASRVRADTRERVLARFQDLRSRAELYSQALQVTLEDLEDEITDLEEVALEVIQVKDQEADAKVPAPVKVVDPSVARREALAAMELSQLSLLWAVKCDGPAPDELDSLVEGIALAVEASEAA